MKLKHDKREEETSVFFHLPGVFLGKQQLWSAGTHGVTQHRPPPREGEEPPHPTCLRRRRNASHLTNSSSSSLPQLSEGIRVWDVSAGDRHSLLLADGDCIQPIIYYSGQQVQEEGGAAELSQRGGGEEEERRPGGGYTQQPVLLPFCMNVRPEGRAWADKVSISFTPSHKPWGSRKLLKKCQNKMQLLNKMRTKTGKINIEAKLKQKYFMFSMFLCHLFVFYFGAPNPPY